MTKDEAAKLIQLADSMASAKENLGVALGDDNTLSLDRWLNTYSQRRTLFVNAVLSQIKE